MAELRARDEPHPPPVSLAALGVYQQRVFRRDMDTSQVAFAATAGEPTAPDRRS